LLFLHINRQAVLPPLISCPQLLIQLTSTARSTHLEVVSLGRTVPWWQWITLNVCRKILERET